MFNEKTYRARWYQANKERIKIAARARNRENPERNAALGRAYYKAHKEESLTRMRAWRQKNLDKMKSYNLAYCLANKKKLVEQGRAYYLENKLRISKRAAEYYLLNREQTLLRARLYRMANPEKRQVSNAKRRAWKHRTPLNSFTTAEWADMKEAFGHRCAYCRELKPLTQDHVIPLSKGGNHCAANIVPACISCNCRKRDRAAETFGKHEV